MKTVYYSAITVLCAFLWAGPLTAQQPPPNPSPSTPEKTQGSTRDQNQSTLPKKEKKKAGPDDQIKKGGKSIGHGFKEMGEGVGKGVSNTAKGTEGAWTGEKQIQSGESPKEEIKEGGREVGKGFKDLGVGIGRGFKNMGKGIKDAWTGDK